METVNTAIQPEKSRRDHWFDAVDAVDIPPEADDLPARFLSAEWRRDGQE